MKQILILIAFVAACTTNKVSEVFMVNGEAVRGYDVIEFYRQHAVQGDKKYTYKWKDANWLFANQANLDSFMANPSRYAPQYGGYCAFGTAEGHKAPTEIETFTVRDGRLYFNYNKEVQQLWNEDQQRYIHKADSLWPSVKDDEF